MHKVKSKMKKYFNSIKMSWTVDAKKAREFKRVYAPSYDMVFAHIIWGSCGALYLIPLEAQRSVFEKIGRNKYIKLPKPGSNPRGIEYCTEAMNALVKHKLTKSIKIEWNWENIDYDPYAEWVEYWGS